MRSDAVIIVIPPTETTQSYTYVAYNYNYLRKLASYKLITGLIKAITVSRSQTGRPVGNHSLRPGLRPG